MPKALRHVKPHNVASTLGRADLLIRHALSSEFHYFIFSAMTTSIPESELLGKLYAEAKDSAAYQFRYARLETVSKLSALLSVFILTIVGVNLATCLLIFLTFQLAFFLASVWGSLSLAILTIVGVYALLAALLYFNRRCWIQQPVTRMLLRSFNLHDEALSTNPIEEVERQKDYAHYQYLKHRDRCTSTLSSALTEAPRPTLVDTLILLAQHSGAIINGIKLGFDFIRRRKER